MKVELRSLDFIGMMLVCPIVIYSDDPTEALIWDACIYGASFSSCGGLALRRSSE